MTLNDLVKEAHSNALGKGWWDQPVTSLETHMLIVSEIAEATEEVRNDARPIHYQDLKPCGEAIELADAIIRIADYFGMNGWDLEEAVRIKMEFNKTRPYRHGGKSK